MKKTISLCMIVKNEEEWIESCLQSVKGIVNEMIVVDTGSTDRTKEKIRKMGAVVIDYPWDDDFSKARNVGLEHASGQWILVLDADEKIQNIDLDLLNEMVENRNMDGYYLKMRNYYGVSSETNDYVVDTVCRLFRNLPHIRFSGMIHEDVTQSIIEKGTETRIGFTDICIHHYGYLDNVIVNKRKNERNLGLIKKALIQDPSDPYMFYALGTEYFQQGKFHQALEVYERTLNTVKVTDGYASDLFYKYVYCLKEEHQCDKALELIHKGKQIYPYFIDLMELECLILFQLDRYSEMEELLMECLKIGDVSEYYTTSSGAGTYHSHFLLGLVKERQGEWHKALGHYATAFQSGKSYDEALLRWANLSFFLFKNEREWQEHFQSFFKERSIKTYLLLLHQALRWVRPDVGLFSLDKVRLTHSESQLFRALFLAQQKNYDEAGYLLTTITDKQESVSLNLYLLAIYIGLKNKKEIEVILNKLIKLDHSYICLYESILESNHCKPISEKIQRNIFQSFLTVQVWDESLFKQLIGNDWPRTLISNEVFPSFRSAPNFILEQLVNSGNRNTVLTFSEMIFLGWASLKTRKNYTAYEMFRNAQIRCPNRLEQTLGLSSFLNKYSYKKQRDHFLDIDSLLLTT